MLESCVFCNTPAEMRSTFLATDLCPVHLKQSGILEYTKSHPLVDGVYKCTETCGCVTLAELLESL